MKFIYSNKREAQNYAQRSVAMGAHGMAASSQQLATLSGYKILSKGGNAVDAAVSMLSTLSVVEPFSVGLGGDAFGLIYMAEDGDVIGLNGSGRAPGQGGHLDPRQDGAQGRFLKEASFRPPCRGRFMDGMRP